MTTTPTTAPRIPFTDLATCVEGALILPADDEFPHAAQAWNLAVSQRPCAVSALRPSTIGDVCEEPLDPSPALAGSASLGSFGDDTLTALLQHVVDPACGLMQAQVRHLGGAFRDGPARPAACGQVEGEYVAMVLAMAPVPEATGPAQAAIDVALDLLQPWDAGPTTLSMLGHHDGADRAFSSETLWRLRDVKESTDPRCVVRGNFPLHGSTEVR